MPFWLSSANARRTIAFAAPAGDELADEAVVVEVAVFDTPCDNLLQLVGGDVQRLRTVLLITGATSLRRSSCSLWSRIARMRIARSSRRA